MTARLTEAERRDSLPALDATGWRAAPEGDALRKVWTFRSFVEAWGFMSRVALAAEKADHHPDWRNSYNVVDVTLSTHDAGGLTMADIRLAAAMDRLAGDAAVETDHAAPVLSLCEIRAAKR